MPRRRGPRRARRRRSGMQRVVAFDFYGDTTANLTPIDAEAANIPMTRGLRILKVVLQVSVSTNFATGMVQLTLYDTKGDIVSVSQPTIAGNFTPRRIVVSAPRFTDYGDLNPNNASKHAFCMLSAFNFASGAIITYAGSVFVQFLPHKVGTQIRAERFVHYRPEPDEDADASGSMQTV